MGNGQAIMTHTGTKRKGFFLVLPKLLKESLQELAKNDPLRMAGATAFFTTFALPPILIILIEVSGLLFGSDATGRKLIGGLAAIIAKESVHQIVNTLINFYKLAQTWFVSV